MKQLNFKLWETPADDPNEEPFTHILSSAATTTRPETKAPASVFDLAKRPVRIHLEQDHAPKMWERQGSKVTGWGEVRRKKWEELEQERKSYTVPPKTPDKARTRGKRVRQIDGEI